MSGVIVTEGLCKAFRGKAPGGWSFAEPGAARVAAGQEAGG